MILAHPRVRHPRRPTQVCRVSTRTGYLRVKWSARVEGNSGDRIAPDWDLEVGFLGGISMYLSDTFTE